MILKMGGLMATGALHAKEIKVQQIASNGALSITVEVCTAKMTREEALFLADTIRRLVGDCGRQEKGALGKEGGS